VTPLVPLVLDLLLLAMGNCPPFRQDSCDVTPQPVVLLPPDPPLLPLLALLHQLLLLLLFSLPRYRRKRNKFARTTTTTTTTTSTTTPCTTRTAHTPRTGPPACARARASGVLVILC
jgi:hypothetical protein